MNRNIETVRISEDIVPVSAFKANTSEWFRRASDTGGPIVVTQNGRPAGVLLSPRAFDLLIERARLIGAIEEGIADAEAGRVHSHAEVVRRMKGRFTRKAV